MTMATLVRNIATSMITKSDVSILVRKMDLYWSTLSGVASDRASDRAVLKKMEMMAYYKYLLLSLN